MYACLLHACLTCLLHMDPAALFWFVFQRRKAWHRGHRYVDVNNNEAFSVLHELSSERTRLPYDYNLRKSHIYASAGTPPEMTDVEEKNTEQERKKNTWPSFHTLCLHRKMPHEWRGWEPRSNLGRQRDRPEVSVSQTHPVGVPTMTQNGVHSLCVER